MNCKSWHVCSLQLKHKGLGVKTFMVYKRFLHSAILHALLYVLTQSIFFKGFFKKGNSLHFEHTKGYFWIPIFLMKNLVLLHFLETLNSLYEFLWIDLLLIIIIIQQNYSLTLNIRLDWVIEKNGSALLILMIIWSNSIYWKSIYDRAQLHHLHLSKGVWFFWPSNTRGALWPDRLNNSIRVHLEI